MRRMGIRFANFCLFVLACFLLASIANQFAAAGLGPEPLTATPAAVHVLPPRATWDDRTVIVHRNLFGSRAEPEPVVEVVAPPVEDLEETALPLLLLGTASTDDPTTARAAISNKSRNRHEVVRVGDRLESHPKVEVIVIEPRRVVLQNGPKREELTLENRDLAVQKIQPPAPRPQAAAPPPARSASRAQRARRARPPQTNSLASPTPRNLLAENLQRLAEQVEPQSPPPGVSSLLSKATFRPEYDGPQMVGVSLSAIEPGSTLEQIGLKDGDRLSQINGVELNDPSALHKITAALASGNQISMVVNGETRIVDANEIAEFQP